MVLSKLCLYMHSLVPGMNNKGFYRAPNRPRTLTFLHRRKRQSKRIKGFYVKEKDKQKNLKCFLLGVNLMRPTIPDKLTNNLHIFKLIDKKNHQSKQMT